MASILTDETLYQRRNAKEVHDEKLAAWRESHERVRQNALAALKFHQLQIEAAEKEKLADEAENFLALQQAKASNDKRIKEANEAAKLISQPQTRVPTPPAEPAATPTPPHIPTPPQQNLQASSQAPPVQLVQQPTNQPVHTVNQPPPQIVVAPPAAAAPQQISPPKPRPVTHTISPTPPPLESEIPKSNVVDPKIAAYEAIHKNCKDLRRYLNTRSQDFKKHANELRRTIRMTVGQLLESGGNKLQKDKIKDILLKSLSSHPEEFADPRMFLVARPEPDSAAVHNGEVMPLLFLFLLNHFSKSVIAQLVQEAGAKPSAAEPIGVLVHQIFSDPAFLWRGVSFIDILLAKYRFSCPVLFGITGNEKTEEGRVRVGWKNEFGDFVTPAEHNSRMVGLAAGYAAITLRNYRNSVRLRNPYAPHHYWTAVATIVNTNPDIVCETQFTVLKALIENHAEKFIAVYGDMAVAALRVAVVSFPMAAREATVVVKSLRVLSQKWKNELGIIID